MLRRRDAHGSAPPPPPGSASASGVSMLSAVGRQSSTGSASLAPLSHPAPQMDEEEQVRLAEELSFANAFDLHFDRNNIADIELGLQRLEEMLTEYIFTHLSDEVNETMSLGSFHSHGQLHGLEKDDRSREAAANDSLLSILRGLGWYKNKIVHEIETSTEESLLETMLTLNDKVASVIARTESLQRDRSNHPLDCLLEISEETPLSLSGSPLPSRSASEREPFSRSSRNTVGPSNTTAVKSPSLSWHDRANTIFSAVYAVKRGHSQQETMSALQTLACLAGLSVDNNNNIKIGNTSSGNDTGTPNAVERQSDPAQANERIQAVLKEMSVAGALPVLLSARQRAEQWPETEMLLCKLVALIAGVENDLVLLQRNASALLEMLYMLQVKTQHLQRERGFDETVTHELMEMRALVASTAAKVAVALASQWRELCARRAESPIIPISRRDHRDRDNYTSRNRRDHDRDRELERERDKEEELLGQLQALLSVLRLVCEDGESAVESSPELVFSCNHWEDVYIEEQETDEYLRRRFSLSLSDLLLGCVSPAAVKQRESANVLASFALLTLCEVNRPQCQAALVAHGALSLLQSWLFKGLSLTKALRSVCAISSRKCDTQQSMIDEAVHDPHTINASHLSESVFQLFGPSIELLHNASRAFLLLCESSSKGSTETSTSQAVALTTSQSTSQSAAQLEEALLNCSIGETIGRLLIVSAGMQDDSPNGNDLPALHLQIYRSVLPVSVTALLTQSILRLMSLTQPTRGTTSTGSQSSPVSQSLSNSTTLTLSLCFTLQSTLEQWKSYRDASHCVDDDCNGDISEGELLLRSLYARLFTLRAVSMSFCGGAGKEDFYSFDQEDRIKPRARLNKAMHPTGEQHQALREKEMVQSCVCAVVSSSMNTLLLLLESDRDRDRERDKERDRQSTRGRALSSAAPVSLVLPSTATTTGQFGFSSASGAVFSATMLLTRGSLASSLLQALSQLSRGRGRIASLAVIASLCEKRDKDSLAVQILLEAGVLHALLSLLSDSVKDLENERQISLDRQAETEKERVRDRSGRDRDRGSDVERLSERASEDSSFSLRSISLSLPLPLSLSRGRSDGRTTPSSVRSINRRRGDASRANDRDRFSERASERGGRSSVERNWEEFWLEGSVGSDKDRDDSDCEGTNQCSARERERKEREREHLREHREESRLTIKALHAAIGEGLSDEDTSARCLRVLQEGGLSLLLAQYSSALHSLALTHSATSMLSSASLALSPSSPSSQMPAVIPQILVLSEVETESLCCALRALCVAVSHSFCFSVSNNNGHSIRKAECDDCYAQLLVSLLGEQSLTLPENVLQESLSLCSTIVHRDRVQRQRVVAHCLRTVCGAAVNPSCERETRVRGERVLVALGFVQGRKDLELCGYDAALLREWHALRESEIPQQRALCIVRDWERRLFQLSSSLLVLSTSRSDRSNRKIDGEGPDSLKISHKHQQSLQQSNKPSESESEESLLSQRQRESSQNSLALVLEIAKHLQLDNESLSTTLGQPRRSQILQPHTTSRSALLPAHSASMGESMSLWQRQFSHSIAKFLPFCRAEKDDHESSSGASISSSDFAVRGQTMDRSHVPPSPHSPSSTVSGGNTLVPSSTFSSYSVTELHGASGSNLSQPSGTSNSTSVSHGNGTAMPTVALQAAVGQDRYLWIDRVPLRAQKVLDLFHESLLLQRLILGMNLIGKTVSMVSYVQSSSEIAAEFTPSSIATAHSSPDPHYNVAVASPAEASDSIEREQEYYLLPSVAKIHSIQLPNRTYQTFSRVGRVLHRLVREAPAGKRRHGLNTINNNSSVSINKAMSSPLSTATPADSDNDDYNDFIDSDCDEPSLGSDSPHDLDDRDPVHTANDQQFALCFRNSVFEGDFHESLLVVLRQCPQVNCLSFYSNEVVEEEAQLGLMVTEMPPSIRFVSFSRTLSRDSLLALAIRLKHKCQLNGLALLRVALAADDKALHAVADLLASSSNTINLTGGSSLSTRSSFASSRIAGQAATHSLRHIDLSFNGLSDSQCALLLKSAIVGGIESLELAGNEIHRATHFIATMERERESNHSIRYLGLSENHLTQHAVGELLLLLAENSTLTHLSLAYNLLESAKSTHSALADFLSRNRTLRTLDLSHNRLSSESYKSLCLSVLENSSLLLLSLHGNPSAEHSQSVSLIQKKLRENRMAYKSVACKWMDRFCMTDEEIDRELSRINDLQRSSHFRSQELVREKLRLLNESPENTASTIELNSIAHGSTDNGSDQSGTSLPVATAVMAPVSGLDSSNHGNSGNGSLSIATPLSNIKLAKEFSPPDTLCVLFSAPLAGFDRQLKSHPLEVLDYGAERETLVQVFRETSRDVALHFDFATTDTLRTLLSLGCRALHFSGHGLAKGLCFEDGRAGLHIVPVAQLSQLLSAGGLTLELVFVSACYSRAIGETFVQAGVQHVVCVKVESQIQDTAAIAFTRAFYIALLSGKTVRQSFDIAKQALINSPSVTNSTSEGEKFILLPELDKVDGAESNVDIHNREVFPARERLSQWPRNGMCTVGAQHVDLSTSLSRHRLPAMPPDFEGREVALNALVRLLLEKRLVSLVGREGEGKSAVAIALTHYLADRDKFEAFVCVRAKGVRDFHSLISEVQQSMLSCGNNSVSRAAQMLFPSSIRRERRLDLATSSTLVTGTGSGAVGELSNNAMFNASSDIEGETQRLVKAEELIFRAIENTKTLLLLDHLDDLLADFAGEATTDMRLFLSRLFEQCPHVRVLNVSCDTLQMRYVQLPHVVEHSYPLSSLSLHSSLRLFAKLAPSLSTAQAKNEFVFALLPPKQQHMIAGSRELSAASRMVFDRLGGGHAARIVHLACESSDESVNEMRIFGLRLNHPAIYEQLSAMHHQQQQQMQQQQLQQFQQQQSQQTLPPAPAQHTPALQQHNSFSSQPYANSITHTSHS